MSAKDQLSDGSLIKQLASMKVSNYQPSKLAQQTHSPKVTFTSFLTKQPPGGI